jgi:hypothetical protein
VNKQSTSHCSAAQQWTRRLAAAFLVAERVRP